MKKLILSIAVASIFASCGGGSSAGSIKTDTDSLAYALGVEIGMNLKTLDSTLNIDLLAAGMKDAMKNDTKFDVETAQAFIQDYIRVRLPLKTKQASIDFLAEIEAKGGDIKKTESGLLYEIILEGDKTIMAKADDTVKANYEGKLKNGKVFDASKNHGNEPAEFALNAVIRGWTEGLQLIGKGGKIKLWIPSELAYGEYGKQGSPIGPNEALEFEVELVDIIPAAAAAAPEAE